jgi:chemotaxis family two-component system sensor kinase Cph1
VNVNVDFNTIVFADRNRLEQVLRNLITNVQTYSTNENEVNIDLKQTINAEVKVSVNDNGIGIKKEQQEHVFDRFFRVEHTSQNYSGLELGLFISSEIIKHHHGEIGVESTLGKGLNV